MIIIIIGMQMNTLVTVTESSVVVVTCLVLVTKLGNVSGEYPTHIFATIPLYSLKF